MLLNFTSGPPLTASPSGVPMNPKNTKSRHGPNQTATNFHSSLVITILGAGLTA